ncbi:C-type lectin domain family 4 member M [Lates calcarifer]|uniref:C-type lectin domain family 4 member M n=2 Tax=Lates calcarifer TaxID=8187 RepID=A0AAJ7LD78_LATCA|nr:C-type lectin domain family 4 member M [Lates calcarifer]
MQQMEMLDSVNEQPRCGQKCRNTNQTERRFIQLLFLSFGVLCITQAILNVSLRLTLYSNKESTPPFCNTTHITDQNQKKKLGIDYDQKRLGDCNRLHERFNALTRDKNLLENRNTELNNRIMTLEEERDRLKMILRELSGSVTSQQCPTDWKNIRSRCYFLSSESKTWEESRRYCLSKGADLVVINTEQEQRDLYRLDGTSNLLFWIGLHDTGGTFKWVDGSALTKPFWQSGQPDRGGPNNREDCVEMYHSNPVLANWNDAPCGSKRHWLCEMDPFTS